MKYEVTIRATITKTYTVEAEDEDEASEIANEEFDVRTQENIDERYEQDTIEIQPTKESCI
jgi:capsular polysaccharide biosynthesis protein